MYHRNSAAVRPSAAAAAVPPLCLPSPSGVRGASAGCVSTALLFRDRQRRRGRRSGRRRDEGERRTDVGGQEEQERGEYGVDRRRRARMPYWTGLGARSLAHIHIRRAREGGREEARSLARSSLARSLSRGAQSPSGLKHGSTACRGPQVSRRIDPPRFLKVRAPVHCADPFARR